MLLAFQLLDARAEAAEADGEPDDSDEENNKQEVFHDDAEKYSMKTGDAG